MKKVKKIGTLSLAVVLSSGILATGVSAETSIHPLQESNKVKIQVLEDDSTILKNDVIERLKELFPGQFDYLNDSDFHLRQMLYPEDDVMRYELDFNKDIDGEHIFGYARFVGEDLQLESLHHKPGNVEDAVYPANITRDEAEQIAVDFLNGFLGDDAYQLSEGYDYFPGNQTLLEPIRYSFQFTRTHNDLPVTGQSGEVMVLGNGEVVRYYSSSPAQDSYTYDDPANVQEEKVMLDQLMNNLSVNLEYAIDRDHRTGDQEVNLVYSPSSDIIGVHAISGEWQTPEGFVENLPEEKGTHLISEASLKPRMSDVSVEQVKAFAEEFLAVDLEGVTLVIESIEERTNFNGQDVISIQYMYEYGHGGVGTNFEINPETGEIVQYHDMRHDLMQRMGRDQAENEEAISEDEALDLAVDYLKEYTPSILHHYAMPMSSTRFDERQGVYHFSFPRIVNDIPVMSDQISVGITTDGELELLMVNHYDVDHWPSAEDVISKDEATEIFKEALNLDLRYMQADPENEDHYALIYRPAFNESDYGALNAMNGEWWTTGLGEEGTLPTVKHPTAEDELNFLISAGILKLDDGQAFDADAEITKGKAIDMLMRSIYPIYDEYYPGMEEAKPTFDNIRPNHPLYQAVEEAVLMGILDTDSQTFDLDATLTKEELAVWYIRGIGLEKAADIAHIYQADFADLEKIDDGHIGYVALADALKLVTAENREFNPEQEITYADMAVSIFKFAELYE